ncbi:MAG: hypothetical protein QOE98_96 [Gaiellaceae bacterium]|jgi:hypothetical protein|nr:hypothetical protein [Gaiellaceae bacterium]
MNYCGPHVIALHRSRRLLALVILLGTAAALSLTLGASPALAATYTSCSLSEREQQPTGTMPKPTYNLSLKRQVTTCATAKKVMKAFHSCRALTSYRCTKKILAHWSCSAGKTSSGPGIFTATYTCTWGKRRVRGTYQQNVPSA